MSDTILQLRDVEKIYSTGAGDFVALKGITLDVSTGEFLGIIGKSGAGKTTLLNMISGVSEISAGDVLFMPQGQPSDNGRLQPISIGTLNQDELAVWRGVNLGIVYQSFELLPQLDLVNNIMLPQEFAGHYQPAISREKAMGLLDIVELTEHAYKLPAHISGGQKQRVAIARALVGMPEILLADEPTGNLDTENSWQIMKVFESLNEKHGQTILMITHNPEIAARADRTVHMRDGRIVDEEDKS